MATNETRTPTATPNGKRNGGARALAGKTDPCGRIARWREIAAQQFAIKEADGKSGNVYSACGCALIRACAEIEGLDPAEFIVRKLKHERADGMVILSKKCVNTRPESAAHTDTWYERHETPRSRHAHEVDVVRSALYDFITWTDLPRDYVRRHGVRFVRTFYRKGDIGLYPAFRRFVKFGFTSARGAFPDTMRGPCGRGVAS